jgi:hypothetical protein
MIRTASPSWSSFLHAFATQFGNTANGRDSITTESLVWRHRHTVSQWPAVIVRSSVKNSHECVMSAFLARTRRYTREADNPGRFFSCDGKYT